MMGGWGLLEKEREKDVLFPLTPHWDPPGKSRLAKRKEKEEESVQPGGGAPRREWHPPVSVEAAPRDPGIQGPGSRCSVPIIRCMGSSLEGTRTE